MEITKNIVLGVGGVPIPCPDGFGETYVQGGTWHADQKLLVAFHMGQLVRLVDDLLLAGARSFDLEVFELDERQAARIADYEKARDLTSASIWTPRSSMGW